ncbi:hypothetical protein CEXT_191011 [Caerostris extrusa]|uniref:Uncharacterized protein n=1 Tax=Caerostris extrusa TaxID=172846 RepID=A0AAV4P3D8_CAEEX|nr:hypothetical protein CEXT_191011 [Caerostris extrusa]
MDGFLCLLDALLLGEDTPEFNESGDITCGREGQINNKVINNRKIDWIADGLFISWKAAVAVDVGEIIIRMGNIMLFLRSDTFHLECRLKTGK